MEPGLDAIQSQLDDIKSAIFVLSDRFSILQSKLDSSITELDVATKRLSTTPLVSAHGTPLPPQFGDVAKDRIAAINELEQQLLAQSKATSEILSRVSKAEEQELSNEDAILAKLSELSKKLDSAPSVPSHSETSVASGLPTPPTPETVSVAAALRAMATKLDEYVKEQRASREEIKTALDALMTAVAESKPNQPVSQIADEDILKKPISSEVDEPVPSPDIEEPTEENGRQAGDGEEISLDGRPPE
ncbi:hypothetical protein AUJ14_03250 [Candidatus Micrarchaeota archaeon CG1_02_55_22]|nr:MAG: hypothetical protein AUJ14_03250 [Candidatus Micrarchaeota archaeon CG1_02_55_22]